MDLFFTIKYKFSLYDMFKWRYCIKRFGYQSDSVSKKIMDIWNTRKQSNIWLGEDLAQEAEIIQEGFELLNNSLRIFEHIGENDRSVQVGRFSRICSVTLAKSSNFLLGCYSLILDGLAQESGAILRPLIETYELLVYIRMDPTRVDEIISGNKPSAGNIARKISGDFKDLREYLNKSASHFNYENNAVRHLFDINAKIKILPTHSIEVLRKNLEVMNACQVIVVFEAVNCLSTADYNTENISVEVDEWKEKSRNAFSK